MVSPVDAWVSAPDETLRWASEVLAARCADKRSRARAWHAAAVVHMERGRPDLAVRAGRRALAADPETAELHLLLAWIEQDRGRSRASLRHLDLAQPRLRGAPLAQARCLRGLNLCVAGQYDRAQRELTAAVVLARRHDDRRWLANALNGRGVVRSYLHRLRAADRDLAAAAALYRELGTTERAAVCVHNQGCVALQADDVPRALRLFDDAVRAGLRVGARGEALIDRAYALLAAGLSGEAAEVLARVGNLLDGTGRGMRFAEASLALAQCAARSGRRDLALAAARRAGVLFREQRRAGWLAAAESVRLRLTGGQRAAAVASRCERYGFRVEAAELRLATGDRNLLDLVVANRLAGPARLRALGWLARARLAALDGDRTALFAACRAGLRIGAADLDPDLTGIGVTALLKAGTPADLFRWIAGAPVAHVIESLGRQAMLCYLWHEQDLLAVSIVDSRVRLHRLTGMPSGLETLRFALATGATTDLADRIDEALLAPLRPLIADRSLVVVPAPGLHDLPWAALPTCHGRPVSVAPSVPVWLAASRQPSTMDNPVWVAGPGLRHADREVGILHQRWGGTLLESNESTMDIVLAAMDGAGLVHIAAHGRYRPEAPAFSYLELADGALYGHDLDHLTNPPRQLVLSACESARSALLRPGIRAVIASTLPVPDAAAVDLVTTLHSHLRAGTGPADALARAQVEHGDLGFLCLGAG